MQDPDEPDKPDWRQWLWFAAAIGAGYLVFAYLLR